MPKPLSLTPLPAPLGAKDSSLPKALKPYWFHRLDFEHRPGADQAIGVCPLCASDAGKWYCSAETGLWDCKVCGESGNALTFLRRLWSESDKTTSQYDELAADRGLLFPETLMLWGAARSIIDGTWLVPGYDAKGKLCQVYRYAPVQTAKGGVRNILMPTPDHGHGMYGADRFDPEKPNVIICEGWGDPMALWEVLKAAKEDGEGGFVVTASETASLLGSTNIIAAPTASVFYDQWAPLLAGKHVTLMFDSDHPRKHPTTGKISEPSGFAGVKRIAALLASQPTPPVDIRYLKWGEEGYDPSLKHGYDVRDYLSAGANLASRVALLPGLLSKVVPVPAEWIGGGAIVTKGSRITSGPLPCERWGDLLTAWKKPMRMRQDLEDVLSTMLSVALSTNQTGDQLFLQVIGDAGSGKTRFCEGMLTSKKCFALEHLTGFHSGWGGENGDDYSLISRINGLTLITPEGDVLMANPKFAEIMSQQRRIFDGSSGSSFKNQKEDRQYKGLRTPWIIAGTPALLNTDQSRLGDRFIRVCMIPPEEEEKRQILKRVAFTALKVVRETANGTAESILDDRLATAYRLTGGYVDHLRDNVEELFSQVKVDEEEVSERCMALAEFTADMRARPDPNEEKVGASKEAGATKELPTRLTHQYGRMAVCQAVVLNSPYVDTEPLRRVKKIALDTCRGRALIATTLLSEVGRVGMDVKELAMKMSETPDRLGTLLRFMKRVFVTEYVPFPKVQGVVLRGSPRWRLTERSAALYKDVMEM